MSDILEQNGFGFYNANNGNPCFTTAEYFAIISEEASRIEQVRGNRTNASSVRPERIALEDAVLQIRDNLQKCVGYDS